MAQDNWLSNQFAINFYRHFWCCRWQHSTRGDNGCNQLPKSMETMPVIIASQAMESGSSSSHCLDQEEEPQQQRPGQNATNEFYWVVAVVWPPPRSKPLPNLCSNPARLLPCHLWAPSSYKTQLDDARKQLIKSVSACWPSSGAAVHTRNCICCFTHGSSERCIADRAFRLYLKSRETERFLPQESR